MTSWCLQLPSSWEDLENHAVFQTVADTNHSKGDSEEARKTNTVYAVVAYCNGYPFQYANDYECTVAWDVPQSSSGRFTIQVSLMCLVWIIVRVTWSVIAVWTNEVSVGMTCRLVWIMWYFSEEMRQCLLLSALFEAIEKTKILGVHMCQLSYYHLLILKWKLFILNTLKVCISDELLHFLCIVMAHTTGFLMPCIFFCIVMAHTTSFWHFLPDTYSWALQGN